MSSPCFSEHSFRIRQLLLNGDALVRVKLPSEQDQTAATVRLGLAVLSELLVFCCAAWATEGTAEATAAATDSVDSRNRLECAKNSFCERIRIRGDIEGKVFYA